MHRGSEVSKFFMSNSKVASSCRRLLDFNETCSMDLCFVSVATWRGCGGKKNSTAGKSWLPERGKFPVLASG